MAAGLDSSFCDLSLDEAARDGKVEPQDRRRFLRGLVDMGSNGIRFSISDLSPPTARILPTLYYYRAKISLYDAQYDKHGNKIPISQTVIEDVIAAYLRFLSVCKDFFVLKNNIRAVATEATRTAINSVAFLHAITEATGMTVELLPKEVEGTIGALGIASSSSHIEGLVMDLGGGSTQITWMIFKKGEVRISPKGAISFPYGAAALTRRLEEIDKNKDKEEVKKLREELRNEIKQNFLSAYEQLQIPKHMMKSAKENGGFPLYLSGGGFRGWGYLLLSQNQKHGRHYPFSIINGFVAHKDDFKNTKAVERAAKAANNIFRVSDRRRTQVPAVAFLVNILAESVPHGIKEARFCQGGVREGVLFEELKPSVRAQDPLEVATLPFARESAQDIAKYLQTSLPLVYKSETLRVPDVINPHVLRAFSNVLYAHSNRGPESSSASALYSTSTGILTSAHGLSHVDRALLCLMLEERYHGELPPREAAFKKSLESLLTPELVWWSRYIAKVGLLLSHLFSTGVIKKEEPKIRLQAQWATDLGKKGQKEGLDLIVYVQKRVNDPFKFKESLESHVKKIQKVGKKKNWIGGEKGWGIRIRAQLKEENVLRRHNIDDEWEMIDLP